MSKENRRVKPSAFTPQPPDAKKDYFRKSGAYIDGLETSEVFQLFEEEIAFARTDEITLYGRADFSVEDVRNAKIRARLDGKPFWRHVELFGWPDPAADRKEAQNKLAVASKLVLPPE